MSLKSSDWKGGTLWRTLHTFLSLSITIAYHTEKGVLIDGRQSTVEGGSTGGFFFSVNLKDIGI